MTLQPIPSEFCYILGKFDFLFYQCGDSPTHHCGKSATPRLTDEGVDDSPYHQYSFKKFSMANSPTPRYGESETLQLIDYEYLREFEVKIGKA